MGWYRQQRGATHALSAADAEKKHLVCPAAGHMGGGLVSAARGEAGNTAAHLNAPGVGASGARAGLGIAGHRGPCAKRLHAES